jgi:hypothetical protein
MEHDPTLEEVAQDLFRLLHAVAPERGDELARELAELHPNVVVDEREIRSSFTATPETRTIRVGLPCLKRQLAMAFAYVIVYRAAVAYAERTGARQFPLDVSEQVERAIGLLQWATDERLRIAKLEEYQPGPDADWPDFLPYPNPESPPETDERMAIELYYMALGVDLHHEFAHLRRGHAAVEGPAAIEQEIEADVEAADWLLSEIPQDDPRFEKRLLGVALSHVYDVFLKLEGYDSDRLHPPLVARLWHRMEHHAPNADHLVWAFIAMVLALHLEIDGGHRVYDRHRAFRSFRDQVDYLLNVYAPPAKG